MDFSWDGIEIQFGKSPESEVVIDHDFSAIGVEGAQLAIDATGTTLSWSAGGVTQDLTLESPICLNVQGSELAGGEGRFVDFIVVRSMDS